MARGLLDHYRTTRLLFVDDEAENRRLLDAVAPWFPSEMSFTLLGSLAQVVTVLQAVEPPVGRCSVSGVGRCGKGTHQGEE